MAPYRTVSEHEHAEAPRDAGIVGDVIAQFADPLAFFRELVQNAIDADSPSIEIELVHDTRVMLVRVRDRGCGMTRDILENQLLVLFRSTKEHDRSKIGKFGIGFASVLAPNPNIVVVQTARDGRRLTLHLQRDLTFQIFDSGPATQAGTTVELEIACKPEDAGGFVDRSVQALVRWCRHATVPITLASEAPGMPPRRVRIDTPLALENPLVEARGVSADGALTAIVGIAKNAAPYAGFFNHGLTLYETAEPLIGRLAFKIQDARLGHTLSRDNVRRDESFTRALGFVRALAAQELPAAIARALRAAATAPDRNAWAQLARAVIASGVGLAADAWSFPLVEGGVIEATACSRPIWSSPRSTALTKRLAGAGSAFAVVRVADAESWIVDHVRKLVGAQIVDVARQLTLVSPIPMLAVEQVFADTLSDIFDACHRGPPRVLLAELDGARSISLSVAGDSDDALVEYPDGAYVLDDKVALSTPFTRTRRRAVVINASHPLVRKARRSTDPRMAATHIARSVLLQNNILDVEKSTAILEYTLARIARGAS